LLIFVMLIGMLPIFNLGSNIANALGNDTVYLNEDFNNDTNSPTGQAPGYVDWSSSGNGVADTNRWTNFTTGPNEFVTVEDFPSVSDRSVKVTKVTNDTYKAESTVDFTAQPLSGIVVIEVKVMSSGTMSGTQVAPYITNGTGSTIVKMQFSGGYIKTNNGGTQQNVQAFTPNTWYDLKFVINTGSSPTYDLYVDGILKVNGYALAASGASVGKVTFKMDAGNNTGTIYFDNLNIYTTVPAGTVTGLAFDSVTYNVYVGDVTNTQISAVYSDNSKQPLTSGNTFSSADPRIASMDPSTGAMTANAVGTTQISVSNPVSGTPAVATVNVYPKQSVDDDFNSMVTGSAPTGWTNFLKAGSGTISVAEVPSASDKSLKLSVTGASDAAEAHRTFSGLNGNVVIEAQIMTTGLQFSVAPYVINNNGKTFLKMGFRNGYISSFNKKQADLQPFVPNQWYALKIVVNTNANTYNVWINGVLQTVNQKDQTPIDIADLITPFDATANTSITEVFFKADNTSSPSDCYVDNVKVYTLPPGYVTGINFDKPNYTLYQGDTINAVVNSIDSDGAAVNVAHSSTLSSLNPGVATIDAAGKLTALNPGSAQLNASYSVGQNVYQAQANVTVNSLPVLSVPNQLSIGTVRSTSVMINWKGDPTSTKYSVYRAYAGSGQFSYIGQSQPGVTAYIDNNVAPGTGYDYKVTSVFVTPGGQVIESTQSDKLTATTALPMANFPIPATGYTVYDNFNDVNTGNAPGAWTTDISGGTITAQEVPFAADKSIRITKLSSVNAVTASRTFTSLNGIVTVEAKVKAMDLIGIKNIPYIYDSNGNPIADIAFNNNNIAYNNNGAFTNAVTSVSADKWYIVRAVLNTNAKNYDVYVDGIKKASAIPFLSQVSDVGKLTFSVDPGNTGSLYFDNVKVYSQSTFIKGPPSPVFDVKNYGAVGDGTTKDTAAIQAAIEAAAGTGGSVYLHDGIFLSGMIQLRSNMTLYIDSSATLKGSPLAADYPDTSPLTYNTQIGVTANTNKALVYAENVENIKIDGGGTIDGSGDFFNGPSGTEATRPIAIYVVLSSNVTEQNIYIKKSGMWTVVNAESDYLTVRNIYLDVKLGSNRDGFDILDCWHLLLEDVTVSTGDDSICIKSGKRRGVQDVLIRNSNVVASGTNGLKFGTASYGAFKDVRFEDNMVKGVKYCAMCVESVDGADISNITFERIDVQDAGNPFFVILGKRSDRATKDDSAKQGTLNTVTFKDIIGKNMNTTWGSPITGSNMSDGTKYTLQNINFINVDITYKGGKTTVPTEPKEYALAQYPESNIFGDLPAYGYYVRHADGVTFTNVTTNVSPTDARSAIVWNDVSDPKGIKLDSTTVSLITGETHNFAVTQAYTNGDTLDVTGSSSFVSSNPDVATVDAAGKVTAVSVGSSVITVTNSVYQAQAAVTVTLPPDRLPPTAPSNLTVTGITSNSATLEWNVSSDDRGVKGYAIYKNSIVVPGATYTATGTGFSSTIGGLTSGSTCAFTVKAYDATGNYSPASNQVAVTLENGSSGPGNSGGMKDDKKNPHVTAITSVDAMLDVSTGSAKAEISSTVIKALLEKAMVDKKSVKTVEIQIPQIDGAKAYVPAMPLSFVANSELTHIIRLATPVATVDLPGNLLKGSQVSPSSAVTFSVERVNNNTVSDLKLREKIGDSPLLNFQFKVEGKPVRFDNPQAPVNVSIPYKASTQELRDSKQIVIWYIDGEGNVVKVPNGTFDPDTGMVTFNIHSFGSNQS